MSDPVSPAGRQPGSAPSPARAVPHPVDPRTASAARSAIAPRTSAALAGWSAWADLAAGSRRAGLAGGGLGGGSPRHRGCRRLGLLRLRSRPRLFLRRVLQSERINALAHPLQLQRRLLRLALPPQCVDTLVQLVRFGSRRIKLLRTLGQFLVRCASSRLCWASWP